MLKAMELLLEIAFSDASPVDEPPLSLGAGNHRRQIAAAHGSRAAAAPMSCRCRPQPRRYAAAAGPCPARCRPSAPLGRALASPPPLLRRNRCTGAARRPPSTVSPGAAPPPSGSAPERDRKGERRSGEGGTGESGESERGGRSGMGSQRGERDRERSEECSMVPFLNLDAPHWNSGRQRGARRLSKEKNVTRAFGCRALLVLRDRHHGLTHGPFN